jgi:hypothetical protein
MAMEGKKVMLTSLGTVTTHLMEVEMYATELGDVTANVYHVGEKKPFEHVRLRSSHYLFSVNPSIQELAEYIARYVLDADM